MALLHVLLMFQCFIFLVWLHQLASAEIPSAPSGVITRPCQNMCGNVSIPYPFGISEGCYIEEQFEITCNNGVPMSGGFNVTNISVNDGQITVESLVAKTCLPNSVRVFYVSAGKFTVSTTKNKLISIGCDTYSIFNYNEPIGVSLDGIAQIGEECSDCRLNGNITVDGSCNGMGCCESSIPDAGLSEFNVTVGRLTNLIFDSDNPCSYAFVAEESSFRYNLSYLQEFKNTSVPVVLDWTVGFDKCNDTVCGTNALCRSGNSMAPGYRCKCMQNYTGNPYLDNTTGGYCQANKSFPQTKFNKIVAGTCISLYLVLVTSFVLGI